MIFFFFLFACYYKTKNREGLLAIAVMMVAIRVHGYWWR